MNIPQLPINKSRFFIILASIEDRADVIEGLKERNNNEDIGILADRNVLTITHPIDVLLDIDQFPLKEVVLGSKDYSYYFSSCNRFRLYLNPTSDELCTKIRKTIDAHDVFVINEEEIQLNLNDFITYNNLMYRIHDRLKVNDKHEFFDGGKKYVIKAL